MEGRYYHIDLAELWRLWVSGEHVKAIAAHFAVTVDTVYQLQRKYKLPKRSRARERNVVDPTPSEIEERAAHCRAMRRAGTPIGGV